MKDNMKVIIFVHTCKLYEETRAKIIEETLGQQRECSIYNR